MVGRAAQLPLRSGCQRMLTGCRCRGVGARLRRGRGRRHAGRRKKGSRRGVVANYVYKTFPPIVQNMRVCVKLSTGSSRSFPRDSCVTQAPFPPLLTRVSEPPLRSASINLSIKGNKIQVLLLIHAVQCWAWCPTAIHHSLCCCQFPPRVYSCGILSLHWKNLNTCRFILPPPSNPYAHVNAAIATPIAAATTTVPMLLPLPALVAPLIWKGSVPLACMTPRTNGEGIRYSSCQN